MNNKKGMIDRNAIAVWMLIASFTIMFVFSSCSPSTKGEISEKVKETNYVMNKEYSLISYLNTKMILEPPKKEENEIENDILKKIYNDSMTFGEVIDMFSLEKDDFKKGLIRNLFLNKTYNIMNPLFGSKDGDMLWDMIIEHSDGTKSICDLKTVGEELKSIITEPEEEEIKLCYNKLPSENEPRDVISVEIPSISRKTTNVKLIMIKEIDIDIEQIFI